ncbi:hypothetical protein HLBENOHH_02460 [Aeromonas dhakensis]|uniref:hypothetical protein n=1 Tax=Aeromonas dhakensis TaxID=196024 RepID=UPI00366C281F
MNEQKMYELLADYNRRLGVITNLIYNVQSKRDKDSSEYAVTQSNIVYKIGMLQSKVQLDLLRFKEQIKKAQSEHKEQK